MLVFFVGSGKVEDENYGADDDDLSSSSGETRDDDEEELEGGNNNNNGNGNNGNNNSVHMHELTLGDEDDDDHVGGFQVQIARVPAAENGGELSNGDNDNANGPGNNEVDHVSAQINSSDV